MRGYAAVGLINSKSTANVNGALRAAHCYGAGLVMIEGERFKKSAANTTQAQRHLPLMEVASILDAVPYGCEPIVVELTDDAVDLTTFVHPERALYIFGPEDGSVPPRFLKYRQVKIPTRFCMNLAATVNVVLYDRLAKRGTR